MIKTIKTMSKQEKERYTVPRKVQDVIPVRRIWPDGIFLTGNRFSKTYRFSDINYLVASREDKESMFLTYSELLNSLDSGAVTKITINNRRLNKANFETSILMPIQGDFRDEYRGEYNQMLLDKATGANGHHFANLGLFFCCAGEDDTAFGLLLRLCVFDDNSVCKRFDTHCAFLPK